VICNLQNASASASGHWWHPGIASAVQQQKQNERQQIMTTTAISPIFCHNDGSIRAKERNNGNR